MKTGAKRNYTFYVLMLLIFGGLFWMVIREGKLWDRAFDKTHREAVEMGFGPCCGAAGTRLLSRAA